VDGRRVVLTRRDFDLLAYLQQHRGMALSRRELMSSVWQTGYLDGDRTIDVHVRRLRLKLGRHAHRLSTLRGYGYRLD
jgi:DNA-binding response OmpR family regulator